MAEKSKYPHLYDVFKRTGPRKPGFVRDRECSACGEYIHFDLVPKDGSKTVSVPEYRDKDGNIITKCPNCGVAPRPFDLPRKPGASE